SDLFTALEDQDSARVAALLRKDPALAGARTPDGDSAVLVALFTKNGPLFLRPQDNPLLAPLLASKPELEPVEVAVTGDVTRIRAEIARDPTFVKAVHRMGWTPLHFASFSGQVAAAKLLLDAGADIEA